MIRLFSNIFFGLFLFRIIYPFAYILPVSEWSIKVIENWTLSSDFWLGLLCFVVSSVIFYWYLDKIDSKIFMFIFNRTKQRIKESTSSGKKKERKAMRFMLALDFMIILRPAIIFLEKILIFPSKSEPTKGIMDEFLALSIKSIPYAVQFTLALIIYGVDFYPLYALIALILLSNIGFCYFLYPRLKILKIDL